MCSFYDLLVICGPDIDLGLQIFRSFEQKPKGLGHYQSFSRTLSYKPWFTVLLAATEGYFGRDGLLFNISGPV